MQNAQKKQNLPVTPRRLLTSERMDAEFKRSHLHPVTRVHNLEVTPQEVGCMLFSGTRLKSVLHSGVNVLLFCRAEHGHSQC